MTEAEVIELLKERGFTGNPITTEYTADGRGKYPYLTGAASWYLLTMITEVFGVRGQAGNLSIEPALLASQFDKDGKAGISFNFAGKRFAMTIGLG